MSTKIYGRSDDLIEFEGDVDGEVGAYGAGEHNGGLGVLLVCSDGTLLEVKYGKADMAVWELKQLATGSLFQKIEPCMDEEANPYSDVAIFKDGLKWAYAASDWERVK